MAKEKEEPVKDTKGRPMDKKEVETRLPAKPGHVDTKRHVIGR